MRYPDIQWTCQRAAAYVRVKNNREQLVLPAPVEVAASCPPRAHSHTGVARGGCGVRLPTSSVSGGQPQSLTQPYPDCQLSPPAWRQRSCLECLGGPGPVHSDPVMTTHGLLWLPPWGMVTRWCKHMPTRPHRLGGFSGRCSFS